MVKTGIFIGLISNIVFSVFLPVILIIYLYRKYRISLLAVLVGAMTFFITQIVLRIPLIQYITAQEWFRTITSVALLPSLFLALTAGLFEETGRFLGFRYLLKDKLQWKNGVAFGLGHAGLEAILLVGVNNIQLLIFAIMINQGRFLESMGDKLPAGSAEQVKHALTGPGSNFMSFFPAGIERLFAYTFHIAFSLIILYAVVNKRKIFLLYAILLHGIVDIPAAYVQLTNLPIWAAEILFFILSLIAVYFIVKTRKYFIRDSI